jgi:hypothetical protein
MAGALQRKVTSALFMAGPLPAIGVVPAGAKDVNARHKAGA